MFRTGHWTSHVLDTKLAVRPGREENDRQKGRNLRENKQDGNKIYFRGTLSSKKLLETARNPLPTTVLKRNLSKIGRGGRGNVVIG